MVVHILIFPCNVVLFNRKQQEGESLLDYSHALMTLMDQIVKSNELARVRSQRDLRDQFCDGVRDQNLGVRLRDQVRSHHAGKLFNGWHNVKDSLLHKNKMTPCIFLTRPKLRCLVSPKVLISQNIQNLELLLKRNRVNWTPW